MNRPKRISRLLDLSRRGVVWDELDPVERHTALRVKWPTFLDHIVREYWLNLRNASKKPRTKVDCRLRRIVSHLPWKPTLLEGRKPTCEG